MKLTRKIYCTLEAPLVQCFDQRFIDVSIPGDLGFNSRAELCELRKKKGLQEICSVKKKRYTVLYDK